jgi:hypothetical protein
MDHAGWFPGEVKNVPDQISLLQSWFSFSCVGTYKDLGPPEAFFNSPRKGAQNATYQKCVSMVDVIGQVAAEIRLSKPPTSRFDAGRAHPHRVRFFLRYLLAIS